MKVSRPSYLKISSSLFCGLLIANSLVVSAVCYSLVLPIAKDRAEKLGTVEASQEVTYLFSLFGFGILIGTAMALVSVMFLKRVGQLDSNGDSEDKCEP